MYQIGEIFYEDEEYSARAEFCNNSNNSWTISEIEPDSDGKRRFQITEVPELTEQDRLMVLREQRATLLSAFVKWEKAVLREREVDDYSIMTWYRDLLDLKETAFENVPARIKYYL